NGSASGDGRHRSLEFKGKARYWFLRIDLQEHCRLRGGDHTPLQMVSGTPELRKTQHVHFSDIVRELPKHFLLRRRFCPGFIAVDQNDADRTILSVGPDYLNCLRHSLRVTRGLFVLNRDWELVNPAVLIEPEIERQRIRKVAEHVIGGKRGVELIARTHQSLRQRGRNSQMPGAKEYRLLTRDFSIQELLADANLPKHCRPRCRVKAQTARPIRGVGFMTCAQLELVEAARMNNRMAADTGPLLFQFAKKR